MAQSVVLRVFRSPKTINRGAVTSLLGLCHPPKRAPLIWNYGAMFVHTDDRKPLYKTEEATKKIRFYVVDRYLEYLKNYDKILERSFKGAMHVYRVFSEGIKQFLTDLKNYLRIVRLLNASDNKFQTLTRKEIELFQKMPKDMWKVAPVLLISALPFANYVVFPVAYMFPRYFLSSHFWTLQQKAEFNVVLLKERMKHNRPVFRCLQAPLETLQGHQLYDNWKTILAQIGSGVQPPVEEIVKCKDLFQGEPYHLFYLKRRHARHLAKLHELGFGLFTRRRLKDRALVLLEMDRAIKREGDVHNLPVDALKNACFLRGLNPTNMRNEDMITWLNKWMAISKVVDQENLSLLLHCPILLAYNEPSNWSLIYPFK